MGETTTKAVSYAGHEYTLEIRDKRIVRIACKGRWPLTDIKFIGDGGSLVANLEYKLGLGEHATK